MVEWTFSLDGELGGFYMGTSCNQSLERLKVVILIIII